MMKKLMALVLVACAITPAFAQNNVGVSIGIHQPGIYGRIDIGAAPQPRIVYPQPVVITQTPMAVYQQPIYLYVPPGHQKNWRKYCTRYQACGQPVYFVRDDWVRERYDDYRHHDKHDKHDKHGRRKGNGHGHKDRD